MTSQPCRPDPTHFVHYEVICQSCKLINTWLGSNIERSYLQDLRSKTLNNGQLPCNRCKKDIISQLRDATGQYWHPRQGFFNVRDRVWTCWACNRGKDRQDESDVTRYNFIGEDERCWCGYSRDGACHLGWGSWEVNQEEFRKGYVRDRELEGVDGVRRCLELGAHESLEK